MTWLLVLPIIIPLSTAVASVLAHGRPLIVRVISVAGAALLLVASIALLSVVSTDGIQAAQVGDWAAPFGITLVADMLAAIMVFITGFMGFLIAVYALVEVDASRQRVGFHALYHILLAGVSGAFLAGDIFNLYVWFEVMMIASFALLVLGGEREQLDGGVKYVAINLVSTILFLTAVGLLYGATGSLNMAELYRLVPQVENQGLMSAVGVLFVIAFGIKAAVFPLFFWLPASYHTPSVTVTAIFAALLTKVGVYALIRMVTVVFADAPGFLQPLLLVVAVTTMVVGVLGAAAQTDVRRILSFHIISQIGYIVLGLALFTTLSFVGAVFYLVHNIIAKTNLILASGAINRLGTSFELKSLGGLYVAAPLLSAVFLISALSLAGMPPLSGFWAKLLLVDASLRIDAYVFAAAALLVGLITLYSMTKIWMQAFWKPKPAGIEAAPALTSREWVGYFGPMLVMTGSMIVMGLWAEPFLEMAAGAADQLSKPDAYVARVLGAP